MPNPKIVLPRCRFWEGSGAYCHKKFELCQHLKNQTSCTDYEPEGGFDAVAAAVREAFPGERIAIDSRYYDRHGDTVEIYIEIWKRGKWLAIAKGEALNDSAALVAAAVKLNSEVENASAD